MSITGCTQMSKEYNNKETLIQTLEAELNTRKHHDANREDTISELNAELKMLKSCMIEFFGMEKLMMNLEAGELDPTQMENVLERKEQLDKIEDMLKTSKVTNYTSRVYKNNLV